MYYKIEQKSNYISVVGINISILIYNKYNTYNIDIIDISVLFPAHCGRIEIQIRNRERQRRTLRYWIGISTISMNAWFKKYININVYILFPALFSEKFQSNDTARATIYWFLNNHSPLKRTRGAWRSNWFQVWDNECTRWAHNILWQKINKK